MQAANFDGVLDEKTRLLILIGIFSTTQDSVTVRHFVSEALTTGISNREIEAVVLHLFAVSSDELCIPLILDVVNATTSRWYSFAGT